MPYPSGSGYSKMGERYPRVQILVQYLVWFLGNCSGIKFWIHVTGFPWKVSVTENPMKSVFIVMYPAEISKPENTNTMTLLNNPEHARHLRQNPYTILLMQMFARSIPLWGLKVITRLKYGSLIQHKHCI